MSKFFNVLLLPGDGIGVEVTAAARKVLEAAAAKEAVDLKFETRLVGGACYDDCGEFLTDETLQLARDSDAVLFGSEGGPKWDSLDLNWPPERRSGLTRLRRQLQLFANLRPIRPLDCLIERSTLKSDVIRGVDFIILRELCGGISASRGASGAVPTVKCAASRRKSTRNPRSSESLAWRSISRVSAGKRSRRSRNPT
jgi:3-isopropylmalate dehydrogenase